MKKGVYFVVAIILLALVVYFLVADDFGEVKEFELHYNYMPTTKPGAVGEEIIEINGLSGRYFRNYQVDEPVNKSFEITLEQRDEVISWLSVIDFFYLSDAYGDCSDGSVENLFVKINGKENNVNVYCGTEEFDLIREKLLEIVG